MAGIWWWKLGRVRCSTGCRAEGDAEQWRIARLGEMGRGSSVGLRAAAVTFEACLTMLVDRHRLEGRRSDVEGPLKHLRHYFAGWRAADITEDRWMAYAARRRAAGAAVATVNLEGARLRRALRLAWRAGRLQQQPSIPLLPGATIRRGWLEAGDLAAILAELPAHYRPLLTFLRLTGWRKGEGLALEWRRVDQAAREIRLETSKTGEPRCVPYGTLPELQALLERQWQRRRDLCPYVFPGRDGRSAVEADAMRAAWSRARARVGSRALIHDLRRTFVRDCERAGVPRTVAMSITGHRSETIYRRYAITAVRDQQEGLAKLAALAPQAQVVASIR
jgi:integrase